MNYLIKMYLCETEGGGGLYVTGTKLRSNFSLELQVKV